jgi:hypothetical protein
MTIIEYALCRFALGLMTPDELQRATQLEAKARAGDRIAALDLKELVNAVVVDSDRRKKPHQQSANKK